MSLPTMIREDPYIYSINLLRRKWHVKFNDNNYH